MSQGQSRSSAHAQPRRRGYALPIEPSRTVAARTQPICNKHWTRPPNVRTSTVKKSVAAIPRPPCCARHCGNAATRRLAGVPAERFAAPAVPATRLTLRRSRDRSGVVSVSIDVKWDKRGIAALETGPLKAALKRALNKAGTTALRDMRSEASKRVKARNRIASKYITRALTMARPKGAGDIASMEWSRASRCR